jgi:hypothetical protein
VKNRATDGNYRILHLNFQPNFTCVVACVRATARIAARFVLLGRSFAGVTNYVVK